MTGLYAPFLAAKISLNNKGLPCKWCVAPLFMERQTTKALPLTPIMLFLWARR